MKKFLTALAITAASLALGGTVTHADSQTDASACRERIRVRLGNGTTAADLAWCDPQIIVVGEMQLGTQSMPTLTPRTRLDVAMRRTSPQSMQFRCARLGGSRLVASHGYFVCRSVTHR